MYTVILMLSMCHVDDQYEDVAIDRYDLAVLNHVIYYDSNGLGYLSLDQVVFYNFNKDINEYICEDWVAVTDGRQQYTPENKAEKIKEMKRQVWEEWKILAEDRNFIPPWKGHSAVPSYNWKTEKYESHFKSNHSRSFMRKVICDIYIETPENHDVERYSKYRHSNHKRTLPTMSMSVALAKETERLVALEARRKREFEELWKPKEEEELEGPPEPGIGPGGILK